MAGKICVSKSNIDSIVKELQAEKENIDKYISKLDTELGSINNSWKGADATKYTIKMREEYKTSLESFNTSFQSYIDFLSTVYDQYKKLDDKYASESIEV